jgi:hypothetical protein
MAAPTNAANVKKVLANSEPSTHGPFRRQPSGQTDARAADHLSLSPSRNAIDSSSTRTASSMGITGRASKTNAGSIEQNL